MNATSPLSIARDRATSAARTATATAGAIWHAARAFARTYPLTATATALVVASATFTTLPVLDTATSGLFYDPQQGFWLKTDPFLRRLRDLGPFLVRLIAGASILFLLARLVMPSLKRLLDPRIPLFLLTTLIIGPGLIVNAILKDHWGRPRPVQVDLFGGDAPYVPIWRITDYCTGNCSFVSGEASSAIWLIALALVAPAVLRRPLAAIVLALAAALSLNRIAFGGHFLSDTVLSWLITLMVVLLAHRLLFVYPAAWLRPARLDAGLDRAGEALRQQARRLMLKLRG